MFFNDVSEFTNETTVNCDRTLNTTQQHSNMRVTACWFRLSIFKTLCFAEFEIFMEYVVFNLNVATVSCMRDMATFAFIHGCTF